MSMLGRTMMLRRVAKSYVAIMDWSEAILALALVGQAFILWPDGVSINPHFDAILMRVAPLQVWSLAIGFIGFVQVMGMIAALNAWTPPHNYLRTLCLLVSAFYYSLIMAAVIISSDWFQLPMYAAACVLECLNIGNAQLAARLNNVKR